DELGGAPAEDRLLAEEVRLALLLERRLDDPGPAAADSARVREHELAGAPGRILVDRHQAGNAAALLVLAPHEVAGPLRGHHAHVHAGWRLDLAEVDREPVREQQQVALRDPVADLRLPDLRLLLIGQQDHHHVAAARRVGDAQHLEALGLGVRAGRRGWRRRRRRFRPGTWAGTLEARPSGRAARSRAPLRERARARTTR